VAVQRLCSGCAVAVQDEYWDGGGMRSRGECGKVPKWSPYIGLGLLT
jgi:hypothetical protein